MEPLASISGLATGVDFQELVQQIIEIESRRLDYLRVSISERDAEKAAWEEVRGLLQTLEDATEELSSGSGLDVFTTTVLGANPSILTASADETASPGRHSVRILQQAQREVLGSGTFASRSDALGLSGQFVIGGAVVDVTSTDSLQDIAGRIDSLNLGTNPIGVDASVVGTAGSYRMVLTASETGATGVDLLDLTGILDSLGFGDGTTQIKNRTSGGFQSDGFADSTTTVATLLGFSGTAPSGVVTIGEGANAFTVSLDLGSMSLEGVRDAINTAASGAGSATFASIVTDSSSGTTEYRLAITGEATATDAGAVLQALGLLEAGRGAVAQVVQGNALTTDAGGTPATASTALTALFNGGSNAGVQNGDTITFQGTDHTGNAFSFVHTISGGDTLQTLLTRLEGAEGFNGSATATVDAAGRITISSATAGASQLSLQAFAGNEGGGILDLGAFTVTEAGRDREITAGQDAIVEIDGAIVTSASNEISDVVEGVTFSVLGADPGSTLEVVIDRDAEAGVAAIQAFVDAYNGLAEFVSRGLGVIGEDRPPLTGDPLLRGIRDRINFQLQLSLPAASAGSFTRLSEIGVEITREGTYTLDSTALTDALATDAASVARLFSAFGSGSNSAITFLSAGANTQPGTYDVNVTQLSAAASVQSVGFGGTYVDDGTPDTITVTDAATGIAYSTSLSNGMTLVQIVDALNASLSTPTSQEITSERTLYRNPAGVQEANLTTNLDDLYHGPAQSSGFVDGTEVTFTGTRPDGSTVFETYVVADASTETLGDFVAQMQSAYGAGVDVSLVNGQIVVTDLTAGTSQLSVNVGADIPGNAAPLGQMLVTVTGADASDIVADAVGSELRIRHPVPGSGQSFSVAYSAGGSDGTGSLGLAAGTYVGTDLIGTINGEAATAVGDVLTADAGTTADGLSIRVGGSTTGLIGTVTYGSGIMSEIESILGDLLGLADGSIDKIIDRLGESTDRLEDRLFDKEARLEIRRENLLERFARLEQVIAQAQSVQGMLASQLATLPRG